MFFEPERAEPEQVDRHGSDPQPWETPPALELGSVVAVERIVARSANVVVVLPTIRAFTTGCLLNVEVVGRQGSLPPDVWWDLLLSAHPVHPYQIGADDRLPDKLMRLGVRYASGAKATTVGGGGPPPADPPVGPVLSWMPGGSGGGGQDGEQYMFHDIRLWLWPLPPPEKIELAVEWPFGGIDLTLVELDGAAIVSAAGRSAYYWADPAADNPV